MISQTFSIFNSVNLYVYVQMITLW